MNALTATLRASTVRDRVIVLALLCALALAATMSVLNHRAGGVTDRDTEAVAQAEKRVATLLSYRAASLEADLATALDQTTGSFRDDYAAILKDVVTPAATTGRITTTAAVRAGGVVSETKEKVVVLVFLTQTTVDKEQIPMVTGSRVEVEMQRVKDTWKIAGLKPV